MNATKRIPDEIFEELCGFTEHGKLETNISQKEFDKKYAWTKINRFRLRNAGDAFFSKVYKKLFNAIKKENIALPTTYKKIIKSKQAKTKNKKKEKKEKDGFSYVKKLLSIRRHYNNLKRIFNFLRNIRKRIRAIMKFIKRKIIKPFIKRVVKKIKNISLRIRRVLKRLRPVLRRLINFVGKGLARIFRIFKRLFFSWVRPITRTIVSIVRKGIEITFRGTARIIRIAGDMSNPIVRFFKDKLQKFINFLKKQLRWLADKVKPLIRILRNFAIKVIQPIRRVAKKLGVAFGKGFKKAFQKAIIKKAGQKILKKIGAAIAKRAVTQYAANAIAGLGGPVGVAIGIVITVINVGFILWDIYDIASFAIFAYDAIQFLCNLPAEIQKMMAKINALGFGNDQPSVVERDKTYYNMNHIDSLLDTLDQLENSKYDEREDPSRRERLFLSFQKSAEDLYKELGPAYNELIPVSIIQNINFNDRSEENLKRIDSLVKNIKENFKARAAISPVELFRNPLTNPLNESSFSTGLAPLELEMLLGGRDKKYRINLMELWKRILLSIKRNIASLYKNFKVVSFDDIFNTDNKIDKEQRVDCSKRVGKDLIPAEHFYKKRDTSVQPPDVPWKVGVKHVFKGAKRLNIQEIYSIWDRLADVGKHFSPYENSKGEEIQLQQEKGELLLGIERLIANY